VAVPDDIHGTQEHPRCQVSDSVVNTSASHRGEEPEDHKLQESSRDVEGDWGQQMVFNDTEHNGIRPRSDRNAHSIKTSLLRRHTGPGGQLGKLGDTEDDWECQSDCNGDQEGGKQGGKDSTHRDSKRVKTTLLVKGKTGQHRWHKHKTSDVPRLSTPPTDNPRWPTKAVNPPHHHRHMKMNPREVGQT
jgi:hypothetical protein